MCRKPRANVREPRRTACPPASGQPWRRLPAASSLQPRSPWHWSRLRGSGPDLLLRDPSEVATGLVGAGSGKPSSQVPDPARPRLGGRRSRAARPAPPRPSPRGRARTQARGRRARGRARGRAGTTAGARAAPGGGGGGSGEGGGRPALRWWRRRLRTRLVCERARVGRRVERRSPGSTIRPPPGRLGCGVCVPARTPAPSPEP